MNADELKKAESELSKNLLKACLPHAAAALRKFNGPENGTEPCEGWFGPCTNMNATRIRMETAYEDEERNWRTLCPECQKACDAHWEEMWAEVYGGILS